MNSNDNAVGSDSAVSSGPAIGSHAGNHKVIVTGGRHYKDKVVIYKALDELSEKVGGIRELVHGGCTGADSGAADWAKERGIKVSRVVAEWSKLGDKAGPIRNAAMILRHRDALCLVAFPGDRGTANCTQEAIKAHLCVVKVNRDGRLLYEYGSLFSESRVGQS
jgi:hypothetical protein